jgi:hypothetical protein
VVELVTIKKRNFGLFINFIIAAEFFDVVFVVVFVVNLGGPTGAQFNSLYKYIISTSNMSAPTIPQPGGFFTFNMDDGFLEALLRGFKLGLLNQTEYTNLCQCENLEGKNKASRLLGILRIRMFFCLALLIHSNCPAIITYFINIFARLL